MLDKFRKTCIIESEDKSVQAALALSTLLNNTNQNFQRFIEME